MSSTSISSPHCLDLLEQSQDLTLLPRTYPFARVHIPRSLTWGTFVAANSKTQAFTFRTKAASVEVSVESAESGVSYEKLKQLLASGEWQLADEETRRLLIVLAGDSAVKRKYVFFTEVQFIAAADLETIDALWRHYSNGKFGYSAQRRIWKRSNEDFTEFFKKVGWMKPLDSDPRQYIYRSFPTEFVWELSSSAPDGHLPLTNALRGTQLLKSVLTHPAFDFADEGLSASSLSSSELFVGLQNR